MAKVTIEDISRQTGLSRGTVSRALNDRPDISEQTKQRVLDACRKLNYVPSHAARSLATGRNYALAALVHDVRQNFDSAFLRGVVHAAARAHYAVHVLELGGEPDIANANLRSLSTGRIDTLVIGTDVSGIPDDVLQMALGPRPVAGSAEIPGVECDQFLPDYEESGRIAARRALAVQPLLYISAADAAGAAQRQAGFAEVCRERGVDPATVCVEVASAGALAGLQNRIRTAAVLVASDDALAIQLMLLCAELGRRVGADVAIIGQGNQPIGAWLSPSLTSIDLSAEEIGQRSTEVVLQRLTQARLDAPQTTRVAPLLIERESTRCLA